MTSFFQQLLSIFSESPTLRLMQVVLLCFGLLAIFLVFYTLRDILQRTRSFWYQTFCILLVAAVPILGFFFYLLIRPSRTLRDQEMHEILAYLLAERGLMDAVDIDEDAEEGMHNEQTPAPNLFVQRPIENHSQNKE